MKKKSIAYVIGTVLIAFAAFALPASAVAKAVTLKVGLYDPEQHFLTQKVWLPYCAEIEKRAQGKIKFQYYHSGSLVKANQSYDAVKNGIVDLMLPVALFTVESRFPVTRVLTLPFLTRKGIQTNLIYQAAFESIPELRKEYDGVKVVGFHATDLANFSMVSLAPKNLEDMKGLKIFAASKTSVQFLTLLGATPRTVKMEDIYMSLQRKALDGVLFPTAPLVSWKLTDLTPHHTITLSACGAVPIMMNQKTWDSLPKDIQKIFDDLKSSVTALAGAMIDDRREWSLKKLKARGDEIYYLPDAEKAIWREKSEPLYDTWVKEMDEKGYDGRALLNKIEALAKQYDGASYKEAEWWGDWRNK